MGITLRGELFDCHMFMFAGQGEDQACVGGSPTSEKSAQAEEAERKS